MGEEQLYRDVSAAIYEAEKMRKIDPNGIATKAAFAKVSVLEEEAAALDEITSVERNIGRRGAITAALQADDVGRARTLLGQYQDIPEFGDQSVQQMRDLISQSESKQG
jgi:hypothetical protein